MVKAIVNDLFDLHRGAKVIVTGHSLGGAMAVLCALDLK
jgi:putative lipase involved disintegration of autophagic bodies